MGGGITGSKRAAFEKAYITHKDRLLTLAAAFTGDRSAAEDVVHDVFASLMRETWRLRDGSNICAYLTVCVRNRAVDLHRKKERHVRHLDQPSGRRPHNATADPAVQAAQDEEAEVILQMVSKLPEQLRQVLSLRIWGELSFQEIAGVEKTTKSTAHARYRQALEKLRRKIIGGTQNG